MEEDRRINAGGIFAAVVFGMTLLGANVSNAVSVGACCWPSGVCTMQAEQSCVDGGATHQGDGSDCANVDCPAECGPSFPACNGDCPAGQDCFESDGATGGGAQVINQCECRAVECMVSSFPACNGGCPDGQECVQAMLKGVTRGGAQVVDQCECREVEGACCWPSGVCTMQTEQSCVDGGATYQGDGIDCADVDCPGGVWSVVSGVQR